MNPTNSKTGTSATTAAGDSSTNNTNRSSSDQANDLYTSLIRNVHQPTKRRISSFSQSFISNASQQFKFANINLPFLVRVMQPGSTSTSASASTDAGGGNNANTNTNTKNDLIEKGTSKRAGHVRQVSNYSLNIRSKHTSAAAVATAAAADGGGQHGHGSSKEASKNESARSVNDDAVSDDEGVISDDEDELEDSTADNIDAQDEESHIQNQDLFLGRSSRFAPHLGEKTNKDVFMDNLMEHAAQLEKRTTSQSSVRNVDPVSALPRDVEGGDHNTEAYATVSHHGEEEEEEEDEEGQLQTEHTSLLKRTSTFLPFKRKPKISRTRTRKRWCYYATSHWSKLVDVIRPREILESFLWSFLLGTCLCGILPLLILAYVLYYKLGNPSLDIMFLPNATSLSWYALLVARWLVTLTLARCTQYFLVLATLRTSIMTTCSGSFVTLMAMQSIGWPFVCLSWGSWNLLLLYGKREFCQHWLWPANIALFSPEGNPDGDHILESDLYGKMILSMIAIGFFSGVKRTAMALFLSRRMLLYFKHQLEDVFYQMRLVTGTAGLAMETTKPGFGVVVSDAVAKATEIQIDRQTEFMDAVPSFGADTTGEGGEDISFDQVSFGNLADNANVQLTGDDDDDDDTEAYDDGTDATHSEGWERFRDLHQQHLRKQQSKVSISGGHIMATMESWDPPVDKASKKEEPTLNDILQFRKAIAFMEGRYPFSHAFGLCKSRETCIKSAVRVYKRLLKFIPQDQEPTLLFDVIGALAYNDKGDWDDKCNRELLRLFTPDKEYRLSMKNFVQSCDATYKKMLFLRAAMSNSSKIDSVLEDIFDYFFYGVLAIVILSLLGLNIWPLLASFSTVLLSFTFAFSASCARSVEGILLIAVRRPYDIGDIITISKADQTPCPGPGDAWFVEDIDLTTTTLRFRSTNEVCTINNSTLTHFRIVNFRRSPKATINIKVHFCASATITEIERFCHRVEKYLKNRPRAWDALVLFRNANLNKADGFITYNLKARHARRWQNPTLGAHKAKLEMQVDKIAAELGILFREKSLGNLKVGVADELAGVTIDLLKMKEM